MSDLSGQGGARPYRPAGWYQAQGDPPGTQRYWDGNAWHGDPQPVNPRTDPILQATTPDTGSALRGPGADEAAGFDGRGEPVKAGRSSSGAGGFLQALFDTKFEQFITRRAMSLVYILALVVVGLFTLFFLLAGLAAGGFQALVALVMAPLIGLLYLISVRMMLEFFVNQFRQSELLEEISAKLDRD